MASEETEIRLDEGEQRRPRIAVVDGNSFMHRAFHAIAPTMNAPDGRSTNAIFGFMSMIIKLYETFEPDGLILAFDKGKPAVRMEMLPAYKAQRPPMDPALREQFPMVKELLGTMNVPVLEVEGWEGDDILGTLAIRGEAEGCDMFLVTGDRDMYQLSTDHITVVGTRKGLSDVVIMDPDSVVDLYGGITPELIPDFYGLKGDSSDNIPGVPGIGPKKAAALILEYGDLDGVIAHADEVPGKMGENLRAHIDDALVSREVARIRTDAPVDFRPIEARFPDFDPEEVRAAFAALGFTGMSQRVAALAGGATTAATLELGDVVEGPEAKAALDSAIASGAWLGAAFDDGREAGTLFGSGASVWVASAKKLLHFEGADADEALCSLFTRGRIASTDVKALLHLVYPMESGEPCCMELEAADAARIFDCGVAAYLLDSSKGEYPTAELAEEYLSASLPEPTDTVDATAIAAVVARELVVPLSKALEEDGSDKLFHEVEMPLLLALVRMERIGLLADPAELARQSAELGGELEERVARLHAEAGEEFNVDSPQQLSHVLFDVIGIPTTGLKKTRKGFYSTNAKVLADLAGSYEIVRDVLEYREKAKIKSTYLDALPELIRADGRIHTTLNQTVTATGRLSSSNPNLQNIPVRSELGRKVRSAFTVPEGHVFLACDYSQIELRLLAHLSEDEHLIAAFREGADFHSATAARVFGVPVEEVDSGLRSRAKAVNFGIVYGQQAYGLSQTLKISMAEANEMITRYFEAYPGVRAFLDETVAFAKEHLWVATMFGRKRHIPDIAARIPSVRAFGERTAMNHPMQGSAADIIKIAMVEVDERLRKEKLRSKLILQIHDELDFEVPEDEVEQLSALVRETMESVVELKVPLLTESSWGRTWAEAK